MTFNGVDMSKFFLIQEVIRPIGNDTTLTTNNAPSLGINIQQVKVGAKKIIVKFSVSRKTPLEIEKLKHELAGILNTREAARLTFEDEPDKYYMAIVNGGIDASNVSRIVQKGSYRVSRP